jgi:mannosyltransferase
VLPVLAQVPALSMLVPSTFVPRRAVVVRRSAIPEPVPLRADAVSADRLLPGALARLDVRALDGRVRTALGLFASVAVALVTALYGLGDKSFWLDETFSVSVARSSWSEIWTMITQHEANMGMYYALLHVWLIFGEGEAAVRALSVVFAVATVVVLFGLVRELFGVREATLASLLLATNALFVEHAQNARGYTLATFLTVGATYLFVRACAGSSKRWWLAYAVVAAVAVYAHFYAGFVVAAHVAAIPFLPSRPRLRVVASAYGVFAALMTPLAFFVVTRDQGQIDWIGPPTGTGLFDALFTLAGGRSAYLLTSEGLLGLLTYGALCAAALAVALGPRRLGARGALAAWKYRFWAAAVFVPIIVSFVISFAKPVFVARYFIVLTPALATLAAIGWAAMRHRRLAVATLMLIFIASLLNLSRLSNDGSFDTEDWRGAVDYVYERNRSDDAIVFFEPYVRIAFDHYARRDHASESRPKSLFEYRGRGFTGTMVPSDWSPLRSASNPRIWLVLSHDYDSKQETNELRRVLRERYERVDRRRFTTLRPGLTKIRVELYRLRADGRA